MDMKEQLKKFDECLQHEISFCSAACPFNMDVNTFISRIQEKRFNAAYNVFRDATGFPEIAAALCTESCKQACLRNAVIREESGFDSNSLPNNSTTKSDVPLSSDKQNDVADGGSLANAKGEPVELLKLEKACLEFATRKDPVSYNIPSKNKSIAIVGAGISGMACALRMATKKYKVTIFEQSDRIGGSLPDLMDFEKAETDFALQMKHLDYDLRLNTRISSLDEVIALGYEDNKAAAAQAAAKSAVASVMRSSTTNAARSFEGTYDAVYIATGKGGETFGLGAPSKSSEIAPPVEQDSHDYDSQLEIERTSALCTVIDKTAVFIGGEAAGQDPIHALADGLKISTAIDNYTLTGVLKYPEPVTTGVVLDKTLSIDTNAVQGKKTDICAYSEADAVEEAGRCLKCQCDACRLHCDLTDYVHKWPLRLRDEIIATTANGKSELHATPAVRLINSCTHCGLCRETCPTDIDMDGLIQSARYRMHKLEKMPWAFNDFFLRDMAFTNGESAYVCAAPDMICNPSGAAQNDTPIGSSHDHTSDPDYNNSADTPKYMFFPGCQLGASSPRLVLKSYEFLLKHEPSTGIMLGCCGVPAVWAGDPDLHASVLDRISRDWSAMGKPVMVMACPTCYNNFKEHLPKIKTVFLYDLMADWEDNPCPFNLNQPYSVFDPCATGTNDTVRRSIRCLCEKMGIKLEPLPVQEDMTACCSFGGHGAIADPKFTKFVRDKRIAESENPYITYCINCRDAFLQEGKAAPHILNIIFNIEPKLDTWTERREHRVWLKEQILKMCSHGSCETSSVPEYYDDRIYNKNDMNSIQYDNSQTSWGSAGNGTGGRLLRYRDDRINLELVIPEDVSQKLNREYILEEEALNTVAFCERTKRTLYDSAKDTYTGYHKIGNLTYWVEYRRAADSDASTSQDSDVCNNSIISEDAPRNEKAVAQDDGYIATSDATCRLKLVNAYTHRMTIDLEMIWNGKKVDIYD